MLEQAKVEKYKQLIKEARDVFASLTDEEAKVCEDWLDEEFRKELEPRKEDALVNSVATQPVS